MFDGRFRSSFEVGFKPVGQKLHRAGISADHLTIAGVLFSLGAAIAIGNGALRGGFLLLALAGLVDVLDGAVAKASGTSSPRGAFFDSVSDRLSDALLFGGVAWYLASEYGGHAPLLPMAVLAGAMLISYERAKAESLGFDARGGIMERAERFVALGLGLLFDSLLAPRAVGHARPHRVHRRAAVREGVAAGLGRPAGRRPAPPAGAPAPGAPPVAPPGARQRDAGRPACGRAASAEPAADPPHLRRRHLWRGTPPSGAYKAGSAVARALPRPVLDPLVRGLAPRRGPRSRRSGGWSSSATSDGCTAATSPAPTSRRAVERDLRVLRPLLGRVVPAARRSRSPRSTGPSPRGLRAHQGGPRRGPRTAHGHPAPRRLGVGRPSG